MLRETELWQNTVISHNFTQKLTQDLRQKTNSYFPKIDRGDRHSVYFVKLTLPM